MPRPRTPKAKAEVSGAAAKNAARFKDRKAPKSSRALGEPYANMTVEQKAAWAEIQYEMPWLTSSDRIMVRLACSWMARMWYGGIPRTKGRTARTPRPQEDFYRREIWSLQMLMGGGDPAESGHAATDTAPHAPPFHKRPQKSCRPPFWGAAVSTLPSILRR